MSIKLKYCFNFAFPTIKNCYQIYKIKHTNYERIRKLETSLKKKFCPQYSIELLAEIQKKFN